MGMNILWTSGRCHPAVFHFCKCESPGSSLIRFGFWPCRPLKPTAAFSMDLMILMHNLSLECAVSVKGFVNCIRWMNRLGANEVSLWTACFPLSVNYDIGSKEHCTMSQKLNVCVGKNVIATLLDWLVQLVCNVPSYFTMQCLNA